MYWLWTDKVNDNWDDEFVIDSVLIDQKDGHRCLTFLSERPRSHTKDIFVSFQPKEETTPKTK